MKIKVAGRQKASLKPLAALSSLLLLLYFLVSKSRIAADDYCNAVQVHETGFFGVVQHWFEASPYGSPIIITALNFLLVNNLQAGLSALFLVSSYTIFFTIIAILINSIVKFTFNVSYVFSFILALFLILIISGQGTNAGGYLYGVSWHAASVVHLLPGILIIISILFSLSHASVLKINKFKNLFIYFHLFLIVIIANSHIMWSSTFFIVQSYLIYKLFKTYKLSKTVKILILSQVLFLINLSVLLYLSIKTDRYQSVGRDLDNTYSALHTFLGLYIHNFWILVNNHSPFTSFSIGLIFFTFFKISFDYHNSFLVLFLKTTVVFIFSSLAMVSLGETIAYEASWHLLSSVFVFNMLIFILSWLAANKLVKIFKSKFYLGIPILTVSISLFFVYSGAIDRLEKWNRGDPSPYGVMTDLDSDWVLYCSDRLAQLPINMRNKKP